MGRRKGVFATITTAETGSSLRHNHSPDRKSPCSRHCEEELIKAGDEKFLDWVLKGKPDFRSNYR